MERKATIHKGDSKMKCPYTNNILQKTVNEFEFNDNDCITKQTTTLAETRTFANCLLDECGAYQGGKCKYNALQTI